jgi:hypothetical protein
MRKAKSGEMQSEYRREDLGKGVRGKHLDTYRAGDFFELEGFLGKALPTKKERELMMKGVARRQKRRPR